MPRKVIDRTGKTYTTGNMQRHLARRLFEPEAEAGAHWAFPLREADASSAPVVRVVLEVFELREKKAFDLLNEHAQVRLVTDASEHVRILGGTRLAAESAQDLLGVSAALEAQLHPGSRSTAPTEANSQSALCRGQDAITLVCL